MNFSRGTALTVCSAALVIAALAGCSSSGGKSSGKLSKADFITQADAVCASTLATVKAAPQPSGLTDYAAIVQYDTVVLNTFPVYLQQVTALADRSADATDLHKNWIDIDSATFAAQKPLIEKLDAAATAKDSSQMTTIANQVAAVPDHSADEATYLTKYGLTNCSALANFGND